MPFKETMLNKYGDEIACAPFIFGVDLDDLETHYCARLTIKPLDPAVVVYRDYFDINNKYVSSNRLEEYETNFFYNDEDDKIILNVFNGFDVALFNISSLLGIGRLELADEVPYMSNGFAPVHDKVRTITWTLEEFKQLDGWVAWFKFTPHFILFKGLVIGANYIHEDVKDGDVVPDFRSEKLLRGENLFLLD